MSLYDAVDSIFVYMTALSVAAAAVIFVADKIYTAWGNRNGRHELRKPH